MTALIGALVVLLLGFAGARFSFSAGGSATGPRFLITAGTHFLLVGWLLGPQAMGLLAGPTLSQLAPLVLLGVGWAGMLFGLQLGRDHLSAVSGRFLFAALAQGVVAFTVFLLIALGVVRWLGLDDEASVALVLVAAASACASGPLAIVLLTGARRIRGLTTELLLLAASLDALIGIIALHITFSLFDARGPGFRGAPLDVGVWLVLGGALGLVFGLVFLLLTRTRPGLQETGLFLMGTVLFLTGAAAFLGVSTLFTATLAGAVVANLSPMRRRLFTMLNEWEKPIYVMLLLLVGSLLDLTRWWVLALGLLYALVRGIAKLAGAGAARKLARIGDEVPPLLGAGLVAQGGIALVIALSAAVSFGALAPGVGPADLFLSVVAIGMVASDLAAPRLARMLLGLEVQTAARAAGADEASATSVTRAEER